VAAVRAIERVAAHLAAELQELYDALRVLAPEMDLCWLAELWMRLGRIAT
jgi:hypothetical protein